MNWRRWSDYDEASGFKRAGVWLSGAVVTARWEEKTSLGLEQHNRKAQPFVGGVDSIVATSVPT